MARAPDFEAMSLHLRLRYLRYLRFPSLLRCDTPRAMTLREKVQAKQRVTGSASENNRGLR
jgi:hypothetical protein